MAGAQITVAAAQQASAQAIDWLAIGPPLIVASTGIAVLLVDAFGGRRLVRPLSLLGALVALVMLLPLRDTDPVRAGFCTDGGCSYVVDSLTLVVQLVALAGVVIVLLMSWPTAARGPTGESNGPAEATTGRSPDAEFCALLLASAAGAVTIAAARDLITLVVALELVTLPAIAVVGLRRSGIESEDRRSSEAALKFFLVSVVSVAVMLFGISLVYGVTGSVQTEAIAEALRGASTPAGPAAAGVLLTLVGFGFKVAAVPFHFWVPETYSGAPIPVAAYLSVVSKAAGLVGLIVVLRDAFAPLAATWGPALAGLSALTMTVANLVALRQTDSVRLLAWSSVAHAGFVLVPLGSLGSGADDVVGAAVAYLVIYAAFNLGAFSVVAGLGGGPLTRFRGLFGRHRATALALAFFLLGLAGLPPAVAGLFAKVAVIGAAVRGDVTWLAVVAAVNVAIGLAYYLRWIAALFTPDEEPADDQSGSGAGAEGGTGSLATVPVSTSAAVSTPVAIAVGLAAALAILLSVWPALALSLQTLL